MGLIPFPRYAEMHNRTLDNSKRNEAQFINRYLRWAEQIATKPLNCGFFAPEI